MNGKIIVVTHKDYEMPKDDLYMPICVGVGILPLSTKYQADDTGDNISQKNITYCELTAIYWAWKNLNIKRFDYIGVTHYRRYFSAEKKPVSLASVVHNKDIETIFKEYGENVVIATPPKRYTQSISRHYISSKKGYNRVHELDIERLIEAIRELSPEYEGYAKQVLRGKAAHMLNMFIMSSSNYDAYCSWLFPVIDRVVEKSKDRKDIKRYAGALSEFCLDIWTKKNNLKTIELPLYETERISLIIKIMNRIKKIIG